MKNILKACLLSIALLSGTATACDISAHGLSKEAVATLRVACEQAKLDEMSNNGVASISSVASQITPERLSEIGAVATEIAKAVGLAARELGIAANEFITTPAGIMVVVGVFLKLFLTQALGIVLLILLYSTGLWMFRRAMIEKFDIQERTMFWGLVNYRSNVPVYVSFSDFDGGNAAVLIVSTVVMVLGSLIIFANLLLP